MGEIRGVTEFELPRCPFGAQNGRRIALVSGSRSRPPSHDDMPVSVLGGVRDDPLATAPPEGVSDLRNLGAESKLPCPVGVANGDER